MSKKPILIVLVILNFMVLLGQLWPDGAPPFASSINLIFMIFTLLYFIGELVRKPKQGD